MSQVWSSSCCSFGTRKATGLLDSRSRLRTGFLQDQRNGLNHCTYRQQSGARQRQCLQVARRTDSPNAKASQAEIVNAVSVEAVQEAKSKFNIVFVTSEVAPFSKTGGLGDVCGSLPIALAARGHRVMVVSPGYNDFGATQSNVNVPILETTAGLSHLKRKGVDMVFVTHPSYQRQGLYSDTSGVYGDNQFRFMMLSLAAMEAPLQLEIDGSTYGQDCVFVANDWHAALVPVYLASKYRPNGVYNNARSIIAIHNLRHQGVYAPGTFELLSLPGTWYGAVEFQYPPHLRQGAYEEEGRCINTLKGGIATADRIVTVSPGYAQEIQTVEGGWDLNPLLSSRSYVLNGILNGIDDVVWNPQTDSFIGQQYSADNVVEGKAAAKRALQHELGLPEKDVLMVGFIGRLDYQKGADLVLGVAPWLLAHDVQMVCLGTGDPSLEAGMRWLESSFPDRARAWVGFNESVSHRITAAADILLMPSRFEPCGLNQLYAMRYGTVPVAHSTGGLKDTVLNFDPFQGVGTGWTFSPCTEEAFRVALNHAMTTYWNYPDSFVALRASGMARNSSWDQAAQEYERVFGWALADPPYCK